MYINVHVYMCVTYVYEQKHMSFPIGLISLSGSCAPDISKYQRLLVEPVCIILLLQWVLFWPVSQVSASGTTANVQVYIHVHVFK